MPFTTITTLTNEATKETASVVREFYSLAETLYDRVVSEETQPLSDMVALYLKRSSALYELESSRFDWVKKVLQNKRELLDQVSREASDDELLLALLAILRSTTQRADRLLATQAEQSAKTEFEREIPFRGWASSWEGITTGEDESPPRFSFAFAL